jgi:hypothetical protein
MAAIAPPVSNKAAFKDASNPANIFKRHRGKLLSRIDHALGAWRDGLGSAKERIERLVVIVGACRDWLEGNAENDSSIYTLRRTAVQQLAEQAFARLQFELFEERKANNNYTGSMQPMQGGYIHERTSYLASGKQQALSGSTASALVKNAQTIGVDLQGKTFNQLTRAEFENLVRTHAPKQLMETEVIFLKKQDRIGKLVVIENGVLWSGSESRLNTGPIDGGWPYVLDGYGNLYTTDHHEQGRKLPAHQRFNHSSFNAGQDVISAGIITCVNGKLWCLDNNSGHYKPDRIQLINALRMLESCGVDMNTMRVGLKEPSNQPGRMAFKFYNSAHAFLANPNMTPHETHLD